MSIIGIIVTLAVVGVLLWLINTYVPMDATIKKILNVVALIVVVLWLCQVFGIFSYLGNVNVHRIGSSFPSVYNSLIV